MKNPKTSTVEQKSSDFPREESFLQRWSQRKLDASISTEKEQVEVLQLDANNDDLSSEPPQLELTDEDMPPLETLDENSDYSVFFSPKVSETLRQQALHKLFHFERFNVLDGLNDYDDDYTQFEKLGSIVTHEMKRLLNSEIEKLKDDPLSDEIADDKTLAVNTGNENNSQLDNGLQSEDNREIDS